VRARKQIDPSKVVVLGVDLSLAGTGLVALPATWGGKWKRVVVHTVKIPIPTHATEGERVSRLGKIVMEVLAFARDNRCTHGVVLNYAFSKSNKAHWLGELGGVVKLMMRDHRGLLLQPVAESAARSLIVGKLPRADVKVLVRAELTRMGMPAAWSLDEGDAFVAANWGLFESGAPGALVHAAA